MECAAVVVNELCDGPANVRLSFEKFKKRVKAFVEKFGRDKVYLTWRADPSSDIEVLDVDELDKPRSGIYRAKPVGHTDDKYLDALYVASSDQSPRDMRGVVDRGYQELLDTQSHRLALLEKNLLEAESRLSESRSKIRDLEDEVASHKRTIVELEDLVEELEENSAPIFDEESIGMVGKLVKSWCNPERTKAAIAALDVLDVSPLGAELAKQHPDIILLLSQIAGEDEDEDGDERA